MGRIRNSLIGWLVVVAAAVAFVSTLTTMVVSSGNRALQRDIALRQQEVNQALQLSNLNTQLVQTLATLGVQRGDAQLTKLLADHGITIQVNQPPAGQTPGQAPAPSVPPNFSTPGVPPSVTR
ncbi:MAG: hypothetical protein JNK67_03910 [Alphaproteobacteria bacterium]|nr:hypothetical protein [Alphaproteobacteria bacterium]